MSTTAIAAPKAVAKPGIAGTVDAGFATLLSSLAASVEPEIVAFYHAAAPLYMRMVISDSMITTACNYGFAAVVDAEQKMSANLPTAQEVVTAAVTFFDEHIPEKLKPYLKSTEDLVLAKLQATGLLPSSYGKAAAKAALPAPGTTQVQKTPQPH